MCSSDLFVSIKDVIRTCNPTVRFSKFTLNINIHDKFVGFLFKLVWRETLFHLLLLVADFPFLNPISDV